MTAIRQRLIDYIETMPEYGLLVVEPILAHFAGDHSDNIIVLDNGLIIETDLTKEEIAECEAGRKEYEENPESFIPLKDVLKKAYGDNWREILEESDNKA